MGSFSCDGLDVPIVTRLACTVDVDWITRIFGPSAILI